MRASIEFLAGTKVVPVLAIHRLEDAVPLGLALVRGGLTHLEVTLRTAVALDGIKAMDEAIDGAVVGVGSVRTPQELERAVEHGAKFAVSPGSEPSLLSAAEVSDIPFLPGAATPSEVMNLLARGFVFQKFFPAAINGGVKALNAYSGPLSQVSFCPTGGVSVDNMEEYLALPNVVCVGGSWMVPSNAVNQGDWDAIETLAQQANTIANQ